MNARDARAWTIIVLLILLNHHIAAWVAETGQGFILLVLSMALTVTLTLLWARQKLHEQPHPQPRRRARGRHPAGTANAPVPVPPAFTASNGLTVRLVEQEPGFPPLLKVFEGDTLRLVIQAPTLVQAEQLRTLVAQARANGDANYPQGYTALDEYLAATAITTRGRS